jgi:4-hydroxy-tetrahydrodipicolinate synthase
MKKAAIKQELEGVIPILPVPFVSSGAVDEASFRRVVEAAIGDGVHGVALFGLASEYAKLADSERVQLTRALVDQAAGRVPAIISITHHSLEVAKREAVTAAEIGADALMVLPPFFLSPGAEAVESHIGAIAAEVDLPVIVQYAPIETGSSLRAEGLAALHNRHGNFEYTKVDVVPSGPMVTRVKSVGLKAMVGYMGLSLPQDVERGAVAVLPTASVSKAFVHLWKLLDEVPGRRPKVSSAVIAFANADDAIRGDAGGRREGFSSSPRLAGLRLLPRAALESRCRPSAGDRPFVRRI